METIPINVNIVGMDRLNQALQQVEQKYHELEHAASEVRSALADIGCEIDQPTTETDVGRK